MKGKGERGGIFSSVFGNLLQRRGKKLPEVASHRKFRSSAERALLFPSVSRFGHLPHRQGSCSSDGCFLRSAVREEARGGERVAAPCTCT